MSIRRHNRRSFLRQSAGAAALSAIPPYFLTAPGARAEEGKSKNDRPNIGCIGLGGQGSHDARLAARHGDVLAVCDVDLNRAESARNAESIGRGKADLYKDYCKLLDRKEIEVVTVTTPDHWHTKITIDALRAGKDVYCEKPLTLTIDEGKKLCKVVQQTGRILQVGTQQRSEEFNHMFLTAVAMVHAGRIGKVQRVSCAIGGGPGGGPFQKTTPPDFLDWDTWLGQTPKVDFIPQRCHGNFRWWYEYSGGKMTDWGAHHVDIAQWGIGMDHTGPTTIEPVLARHPVPLKKGYPTTDDCFNTATAFLVKCLFPNGVEMTIRHDTDNGILFEGDRGRIFVNRGRLSGTPVEALREDPLPDDSLTKLRKGHPLKPQGTHVGNLFDCVKTRAMPVSDVFTHHRTLTTCHLANIAIRLGRKLTWDPHTQQIVGDEEANAWQSRPQRKGFEIEA